MSEVNKQAALDYHEFPTPGKVSVEITKPAETQRDLALAYSPGVAEPVRAIAEDPANAYKYTAKGNTVAVITDGSAILGLGNLGPLASKPVMEGKSLLFKRFAGIDSIDLEVTVDTPEQFIATVKSIADSFGGINLEDIKAPECFQIEKALKEECNIPVFHDDQHGTAIVTGAGLLNALDIQGKNLADAKITCVGAGAAALACLRLIVSLGAQKKNIFLVDRTGVVYEGRGNVNEHKAEFANKTDKRTMADAVNGADVFLGLSGANVMPAELLATMAPKPVVFACSNPDPEIKPELALATRSDLIMATGRSDYPNQVNNVLGFPFIFRGALDVRASCINEEMKIAAVYALRDLARSPVPAGVVAASEEETLEYGSSYIIPKPMDPRLLPVVSKAVALAAVESGVATIDLPAKYQ